MANIAQMLALAVSHHQAGRAPQAEQLYRQILAADPRCADAWNLCGMLALQCGQSEAAGKCFDAALELNPNWPEALLNRGTVFDSSGRTMEAIACYRKALSLRPNYPQAHYNLGRALQMLGQLDEAATCYRTTIALMPDHAKALNNLASLLNDVGQPAEAEALFRRTLTFYPSDARLWSNLGNALKDQGKLDEAVACYRRAIELEPNVAEPHFHWAMIKLLCGDFVHGWSEYEWRWKTAQAPGLTFTEPRWQGEPLAGKTILLYGEQGLGDTLQFIRYAPLVKALGAKVVAEVQPPLVKLLATAAGIDDLIPSGAKRPTCDFHAPLLSLPGIFKSNLDTIPASVPYLAADTALVAYWRDRLAAIDGFKIGINWRGRGGVGVHRHRDIPLEHFSRLAKLPGVRLISLQKQLAAERAAINDACPELIDLGNDFDTSHGPFMDTAAVMTNVDLVVTSDTAIPHLAGALGASVWLALPLAPDWRWLLDRADSPWYPTMRLYRQRQPGEWHGVFEEIAAEIQRQLAKRVDRAL